MSTSLQWYFEQYMRTVGMGATDYCSFLARFVRDLVQCASSPSEDHEIIFVPSCLYIETGTMRQLPYKLDKRL